MRVDFHGPANATNFGYGRAHFGIRPRLERMLGERGHDLVPNYTGGDVGIYFSMVLDKLADYWRRKSPIEYAFTMWESSRFSKEICTNLEYFDGYILPSEWGRDMLAENGIAGKPAYVVPLGIEPDDWPYLERPESEIYRIIWQGTFLGDRKGGLLALKVFNELNLPHSQLILKCNPHYPDAKAVWDPIWLHPIQIARLLKIEPEAVNDIRVCNVGKIYEQPELLEVLRACDLALYPSFGEGFGLIPLEQMATGLPVILGDNTGMSMYADPAYCLPVSCKPRCSSFGPEFGIDFAPDEDALKRAILWAYEHRPEAKAMGVRASAWVRENWTYERTAQALCDIIEKAAA